LPMGHPTSVRQGCFACRSTSKASEVVCERRAAARFDSRPSNSRPCNSRPCNSRPCNSRSEDRRRVELACRVSLRRARRTARAAHASRLERRRLEPTMCGR
jgi:hypothetical protein